MRIRYPGPIEKVVEEMLWSLSEHLYRQRMQGASYRELAETNGMDRATVRRYARTYASALQRYGWDGDHPPSCNEIPLRCSVCDDSFFASRAGAHYCSNACRQDAYRKRKLVAA